MPAPWLILSALFAVCFSCATTLNLWFQHWAGNRSNSNNALTLLMGDSRRMFANHFFVKADMYFHKGYYPTIFDQAKKEERLHVEEDAHGEHGAETHEEEEADFLGKPRDWIEAFGRNFFPTEHSHLTKGEERELLPWIKLSAEMDPQKVQTYTVGAFWLRTELGKVKEAEELLRQGWRENPDSYEILFELGRIRDEHYHDSAGARNLWALALNKYQTQTAAGAKPDEFSLSRILASLGKLEEKEGNYNQAIRYYSALKEISPSKAELEKEIAELQAKIQK